jgi:hypothetical protein
VRHDEVVDVEEDHEGNQLGDDERRALPPPLVGETGSGHGARRPGRPEDHAGQYVDGSAGGVGRLLDANAA